MKDKLIQINNKVGEMLHQGVINTPLFEHVLQQVSQTQPVLYITILTAITLVGLVKFHLVDNEERLKDVVEEMIENKEIYTDEILEDLEYQRKFALFLENHIRLTGKKKLELSKKILLDMTLKHKEVGESQFERIDWVLIEITNPAIRFLSFLKTIKLFEDSILNPEIRYTTSRTSISELINTYFKNERYRNEAVKYWDIWTAHSEILAELLSLGIVQIQGIKQIVEEGEIQTQYVITDFGKIVVNILFG